MHEFGLNYISALKYSPFSASCYNNIIVNRNIPYRGIYFLCDTCTCIICVLAFWHNYKNANFRLHPHRYHGKEQKHNKLFHTRFFIICSYTFYVYKIAKAIDVNTTNNMMPTIHPEPAECPSIVFALRSFSFKFSSRCLLSCKSPALQL